MPAPTPLERLSPVLATLFESRDPGLRERVLFEAVRGLGLADALALWRGAPGEEGTSWRAVLERGPADLLPAADLVRAVLAGELPPELPHGGLVLVARRGDGRGLALVLGQARAEEEDVDLLEALLVVWSRVEEAEGEAGGGELPPLPRTAEQHAREDELAHDFANLLTGIEGGFEVLAAEAASAGGELRERIDRELERAGALLRRALGGASSAAGPERTDAARTIADVCESETALCRRHGIDLELHVDPRASGRSVALGDADLERVLRNLLVNARQALQRVTTRDPAPQGIRVAWEPAAERSGELRLRVTDDGPGLSGPPGGVRRGLGLRTVHALVEGVGGRVEILSLPTGGADVRVHLPAAEGPS